MDDDPDRDASGMHEFVQLLADDQQDVARLARIRSLSDGMLSHYYALLSDNRYVINVPFLPLFERELRARGLPLGRQH